MHNIVSSALPMDSSVAIANNRKAGPAPGSPSLHQKLSVRRLTSTMRMAIARSRTCRCRSMSTT